MNKTDDENLMIIGEVLEQLDEDNLPRKKPSTIEDQYALDAQGRRRFHGAFTGGFSAGYFNSVDTRDGWTPHQFKSSRTKKAESVCQRPEDFMDDEDTAEFGIAAIGIRASNDFANHTGKGTKRERAHTDNNGPIPGSPVLKELLKTVTDTVGVKLLKKMGWKLGQGVGPRLRRLEKQMILKKHIDRKNYCSLSDKEIKSALGSSQTSIEDVELDGEILFAPHDLEPFRCTPKDNYFGIGYSGLNKLSKLSGDMNLAENTVFRMQDKNKKLSIRGQAFGVGAFEADDDDIYERDDMSRYDFALHPEEKKNNRWSKEKNCGVQQCNCLEGFVLAELQFVRKQPVSPPNAPENFKPIHIIRQSRFSAAIHEAGIENKSNRENQATYISNICNRRRKFDDPNSTDINGRPEAHQNHELLIKRNRDAEKLSECTISSPILDSVVERQLAEKRPSAQSRDTLSRLSWMDKLTTKSFVHGGIELPSKILTPHLDTHEKVAPSNSSGETCHFGGSMESDSSSIMHSAKPFGYDAVERGSVDETTKSPTNDGEEKLGRIQCLPLGKRSQEREAEESTTATELIVPTTGLQCTDTRTDSGDSIYNSACDKFALNAAKMRMFGKMTRTLDVWRPVNAVCKRFNISEPEGGCGQTVTGKAKSHHMFEFLNFCSETNTTGGNWQKSVDIIPTHDQSMISSDQGNNKSSNVECVVKSFNVSNVTLCDSAAKPQLERSYNSICNTPVENIPATELTGEQYSEPEFGKDREITKARDDGETNVISFKSSPLLTKENVGIDDKLDLFKEIFLSCSESSESDNESIDTIHSVTVKSLLLGKPACELNTQRNTSPARGIFAQLNFDEAIGLANPKEFGLRHSLCPQTDKSDMETSTKKEPNIGDVIECESETLPHVYGPALPIKLLSTPNQSSCDAGHSSKMAYGNTVVPEYSPSGKTLTWVEKPKIKKSKKMKKKQKQKYKSKDRKHKHKSDRMNIH